MIELQTMNEIPIYTIIKIEAEEAEIPMLTFYVKEDTTSNTLFICKKERGTKVKNTFVSRSKHV